MEASTLGHPHLSLSAVTGATITGTTITWSTIRRRARAPIGRRNRGAAVVTSHGWQDRRCIHWNRHRHQNYSGRKWSPSAIISAVVIAARIVFLLVFILRLLLLLSSWLVRVS